MSHKLIQVEDIGNYKPEQLVMRGKNLVVVGVNSMNLSNEIYYNQPTPEWVKQVNTLLREEVKDSPAYDPKKQTLTFYVDW